MIENVNEQTRRLLIRLNDQLIVRFTFDSRLDQDLTNDLEDTIVVFVRRSVENQLIAGAVDSFQFVVGVISHHSAAGEDNDSIRESIRFFHKVCR